MNRNTTNAKAQTKIQAKTKIQTKTKKTKPDDRFLVDYDRYASMEFPIKSYCLDMISYYKATRDEGLSIDYIINLLDKLKIFEEYRDWEARFDDCYFEIPYDLWLEKTGLEDFETEELANCFRSYFRSIDWDNDGFTLYICGSD